MQIERIKQELTDEIQKTEEIRNVIMERLRDAPHGQLNCKVRGKGYQYYLDGKYQSEEKKALIVKIANIEYLEKLQSLTDEKIRKLNHIRKCFSYDFTKPEAVYENLHPARKRLVTPLIESREERIKKWQEEPYERWEITDDDVQGMIITDRGERVRSKSEKIIADALYRRGIPYRYEYPLKLRSGRHFVPVRPDFLVLSLRTMEEMIIEHLGMMDDETYYERSMVKIDMYEKNGYLIGQKLLLLHESREHPLDMSVMEKYIEAYLVEPSF